MFVYAFPRRYTCRGRRVRDNKPCAIRDELDTMGYCKYHSPLSLQCRGCKGVKRCEIRWDLDEDIMCEYHGDQDIQCYAFLENGKRCEVETDINRHGFCPRHPERREDALRDFTWHSLGLIPVEPPPLKRRKLSVDVVPKSLDEPADETPIKKESIKREAIKVEHVIKREKIKEEMDTDNQEANVKEEG